MESDHQKAIAFNLFRSIVKRQLRFPRNCWMSAEFVQRQYGVTDLSHFEFTASGWGSEPRFLLPFHVTVGACHTCGRIVFGKAKTCGSKCRKILSRNRLSRLKTINHETIQSSNH